MSQVQIDEVHTDITVSDRIGALSPEDMRKIIRAVMEHLHMVEEQAARKDADDSVGDRNYVSDVKGAY